MFRYIANNIISCLCLESYRKSTKQELIQYVPIDGSTASRRTTGSAIEFTAATMFSYLFIKSLKSLRKKNIKKEEEAEQAKNKGDPQINCATGPSLSKIPQYSFKI